MSFVHRLTQILADLFRECPLVFTRSAYRNLVRPIPEEDYRSKKAERICCCWLFFCLLSPRNFRKNEPETSLTLGAGRHQSVLVRSKYFKKNEKKACQASQTPVILTAKPNQTNGETNDQIRT
jgi:hypothetical protein